jgi:HNH endonuclease
VAGHTSHHAGRLGSATGHRDRTGAGCGCRYGRCDTRASEPLSPHTRRRLRRALLALATDALSGPGGLAAQLRAGLDGPIASVSLPLDVGPATETIPAHLRRAVTIRHPHCAFPGCGQPASVCDIHHIIPRSRGGPTSLDNLLTLCTFHHKIVVHRWGWALRLNADGTTTATSPYGKVLHSHSPPGQAA